MVVHLDLYEKRDSDKIWDPTNYEWFDVIGSNGNKTSDREPTVDESVLGVGWVKSD